MRGVFRSTHAAMKGMKMLRTLICVSTVLLLSTAICMADDDMAPKSDQASPTTQEDKQVPPVLTFKMDSLDGKPVDLSKYQGKVIMMVNVASKCGFTPQYKDLEALHEKYADKGLVILGFPANDFHHQEPGTNAEIGEFCTKNYGVKFDMFSKIVVTGKDKAPLYDFLTSDKTDPKFPGEVKWNFEKFLISRDGQIVERFRSKVKPSSDEVTQAIEAELAKKG
jgi:glutathione peroxidase